MTTATAMHTLSLHDALPISAPEVEKTALRAQALCQQLGKTPQLVRALQKLATVRFARAEHQTARELAEQGLSLAQDRKSTRLNSSHLGISYAVFCLKKKITK